ncbi:acetate kinase [Rubrivirga sp. S365]|uniref:Acetate kinase n=1 Tax=Rubrivirga litoralis TaxID=3075598 RepID=A0ABU3BR19_9BACT|nr:MULTISPECIES: acetate kinase [unclassified Rubrivirga]MDT0631732.1 acetate kinase [Rubrivirga sp. F394]MDT7856104.1 acetate kinase [Rubrivirga sp. S365]
MVVLVINAGSSSLKVDLIDAAAQETLASGQVERVGAVSSLASFRLGEGKPDRVSLSAPDHAVALDVLLGKMREADGPNRDVLPPIEAVGHRVVHGGERFAESALINGEVVDAIRDAFDLAPLHNPANLRGILAAQKTFPDVPQVAVFDTAFHQTIPPHAYLYALPNRLYRRHKIRRYGFHGTSHYYVSRRLYELAELDKTDSRVLTLHLGNGCSACAIRDGRSVDTSMGMTPLEGLVMGTRSGDLDPSIVFDLVDKEEMPLAEVYTLLNRYSGLLGLSGYAADMRDLLAEAADGDVRCQQAIDVFCYRVKSYVGRYLAVLGGLDAVAFTAGIGTFAAPVRAQILDGLEGLGIVLDADANEAASGAEARISTLDSPVQAWVVPTNEELVIALDTMKLAGAAQQTPFV